MKLHVSPYLQRLSQRSRDERQKKLLQAFSQDRTAVDEYLGAPVERPDGGVRHRSSLPATLQACDVSGSVKSSMKTMKRD